MNLQEFLQLESEKFAEAMIDKDDWFLSDHDTRLINKVLDEVKREVEILNKHYLCGACTESIRNLSVNVNSVATTIKCSVR